jgi:hypothetical protein
MCVVYLFGPGAKEKFGSWSSSQQYFFTCTSSICGHCGRTRDSIYAFPSVGLSAFTVAQLEQLAP